MNNNMTSDVTAFPSQRVETSSGALGVIVDGDVRSRLPTVLLHGGGMDRASLSWARLIGLLSIERLVIAPDLPGFGDSLSLAPVGSAAAMAGLVIEVLDRLGIERAVLIGVSMGGDVALNLALEAHERVAGLVLIAPGGLAPVVQNRAVHLMAWATAQLPDYLMLPLTRYANRFVRQMTERMVKNVSTLPPDVVERFIAEASHDRAGIAYLRYNQASLGPLRMRNDLSERVQTISVPTLLFHGKDDALVSPDDSRRAAARMPHARLVIVPDCGHWAQFEAHESFTSELDRFFTENRL